MVDTNLETSANTGKLVAMVQAMNSGSPKIGIKEACEYVGLKLPTYYAYLRRNKKGEASVNATPDIVNNPATAQRDEASTRQVYPQSTTTPGGVN